MLKEAEARTAALTEPIETVYLGGGTPSVLPAGLLEKLIGGLRQIFPFDRVTEFTVEANPGTVTPAWLQTAAHVGINRISLGMQACQDGLLRFLGRIHRFEDVQHSVALARENGLQNINLDLMFGIPGQTRSMWQETMGKALALQPTHISAYGLIPEENTPLYDDLKNGKYALPDPDEEREMYDDAIRLLARNGYRQYEISNFAREGYECRHNIGYWTQVPYLGLGLSAASMTGITISPEGMTYTRRTNPATLDEYERMLRGDESLLQTEEISPPEARFETLMLGLRMNRGVSDERFLSLHGKTMEDFYGKELIKLSQEGLIIHRDGCLRLTRRGFDLQNTVLVELMKDD